MNYFEIFAHGATFDADAYVARTDLPISRVWRRGSAHYTTSGIAVTLGDGGSLPVLEQEGIAIAFLARYRDALAALGKEPGIDVFILRLHVRMRFEEGLTGFSVGPSTLLMRHALDVGVEPSFFVALEVPVP